MSYSSEPRDYKGFPQVQSNVWRAKTLILSKELAFNHALLRA